jgi:exonuclease III
MRIVAWNIRAGGGTRVPRLVRQLARWTPDVVAFCEFRATPPSFELARILSLNGLAHQCTTADPAHPTSNRLLIASRWPLAPIRLRGDRAFLGRWLLAQVQSPAPFALAAVHVPNRVTGIKWEFLDAVLARVRAWQRGPALLVGDTNSGIPGLDDEVPCFNAREAGWMRDLDGLGWADGFRQLHGEARAYTWYSPNGRNGFRLDQAFVNRQLAPRLKDVRHAWGGPGRAPRGPSDHAALVLDLAE